MFIQEIFIYIIKYLKYLLNIYYYTKIFIYDELDL